MTSLPELPATDRLVLRSFRVEDLPAMVAYRSDPEVARFQSWEPTWSIEDAQAFLQADQRTTFGTSGAWSQIALEEGTTGALCGELALYFEPSQPRTIELGITLDPDHQGKGLASEALRAVISWLFEHHGTHRVLANVDARNRPVRQLLEKLGLRLEAELLEADWFKEEWTTLRTYAILQREWPPDR